MSNPIFWSSTKIQVGATHATALAITAISKANPAVVTYTGTDPVNGTFVYLPDVVGMVELRNRAFRIAAVDGTANTFQLEGEDSTAYTTFVSGTAVGVATFDSMTTVQDINASGGDANFAVVTTVHDSIERRVPTTFTPISFVFGNLYDPGDAAMVRLIALSKSRTPEVVVFTFSDGAQVCFYAYVGASGSPTGSAQQAVKTSVSLEAQGAVSVYGA